MSIFFADLDNTLIYSNRWKFNKPQLVVEHLNERDQSFMTELTYDFLLKSKWLDVIPVTTRTEQQFRRIECFEKLGIKRAIVCNGGKLLVEGKEDSEWSYKTEKCVKDNYYYLDYATEMLSSLCKNNAIHRPEKYMTYVKCSDPENIYRHIRRLVDSSRVNVQRDGKKVYLFANGVSKGEAVNRYLDNKCQGTVIAAGDNLMDVSMLNRADIAFANNNIFDLIMCSNKIKIVEEPFSDGICKNIYRLKQEGII